MAKSDEILSGIRLLNAKLYGENGFEGDIPAIKTHLEKINIHLDDHSHRITTIEATRRLSKKVIGGSIGGVATIVALVILEIGQRLGWWANGG